MEYGNGIGKKEPERPREEVVLIEGKIKPPIYKDPNLIKNIIKGIIVVSFLSGVILLLTRDALATLTFVLTAVLYGFACVKKVVPEEKAIKITLWTPNTDWVYSGGVYWRWFLFEWFYAFPTEQIVIDIPEQEIITQEKTVNGKTISGAVVKIDSVFYGFWPDDAKGLCLAYKKAPDPYNEKALKKFFVPFFASVERRVAGRFDWLELQQTQKSFVNTLDEEIREDEEGPMAKSRITEFSIQFEVVKLPTGLAEAITAPQISAFKLEAGKKDAELDKIKKKAAGEGDAYAREQLLGAMKKYPVQAINIMYEEMAKGQASTIFFELPSEMKNMIGQGGEIPEELKAIWNVTPKPERALLMKQFLLWLKNKK